MSDIRYVCVLLILSVVSATEKTSLENRDVELQWNIPPQGSAQLVPIVHPSGTNMFIVLGDGAYDTGGGFNGRYNFTGDITTGNIDFIMKAVTRTDAGTYYSTAGNTRLGGITLVVYLQPEKTIISVNVEPAVGSSMVVNCSTRSNSVPAGHTQPMFYTWYIDSNKVTNGGRYQLSGSQLTLTGITRSDDGLRITCTAEETPTLPSDSSDEYSVNVQYGPGPVTLSPTRTAYTLLETKDTLGPITCSADCKPACTYQWKHDGTDVTTGDVLRVNNITRGQAGTYTCTATNKHNTQGRVSNDISVVVEYGPGPVTLSPTSTSYKLLETRDTLGPITCSADCKPVCIYQWKLDGTDLTTGAVLRVNNITRGQAGTNTCTATNKHNTQGRVSNAVSVVVEYGPGPVTLSPTSTSYTLLEARDTLGPITCSADCKPACTYQWKRDGTDVTTGDVLRVNNITRGQAGTFTCTATNTHNTQGRMSNDVNIVVEYGPGPITLLPTSTSYTLLETRDTLGPITCSADCKPACTYQWKRDGTDVTTGDVLRVNNITRGQVGTYTCTATNKHNTQGRVSNAVSVVVEYGPGPVTLSPTGTAYTLLEARDTLGPITCGADCKPACTYQWKRDGTDVTTGDVLRVNNIIRGQAGTYTCTATNKHNTQGRVSNDVNVVVEYGPGPVTLSPTGTAYTLLEARDTLGPITCGADCKPACTYQWKRDGTDVTTGDVLRVNNIIRGQAGTYTCTATNKHNTQERVSNDISVVVEYAPSNTHLFVTAGEYVSENSTIEFICTTESFPPATMQLIHDGDVKKTVMTEDNTVNSTFIKSKVDCLDTGKYVCNARNKIGSSSSRGISLYVFCSPRPDTRGIISTRYVLGDREDLNISGNFLSYQKPEISWLFRRNESQKSKILINNTDNFEYYTSSRYIIYTSHALRTQMRTEDFGQYLLHVSNDIGYYDLIFDVFLQRHPDPPVFVKVECTYDKAEIVWISKFNGGNEQHFRIGMKTSDDLNFKQINSYGDPGENKIITGTVTGLYAGTTYFFTVFAINSFGSTSISNSLYCETQGSHPSSNNNTNTGPNTASIVLFAVGALLCVASITGNAIRYFIKRRNLQNDREIHKDHTANNTQHTYEALGEHKQSSESHYQELATPGYDNTRDTETRNAYADLGQRDLPNVYEKIKPKTKGKLYENTCFNPEM